jgi:hypothetical protein
MFWRREESVDSDGIAFPGCSACQLVTADCHAQCQEQEEQMFSFSDYQSFVMSYCAESVNLFFLSRQQRSKIFCNFWLHLSEVLCSSHFRA